jgi:uncharacterized protein DUF4175
MTDATYDALRQVIHDVRRRWRLKVALRGLAVVLAASLATIALSAWAMDHFRYEDWAVSAFRLFAYVSLLALAVRFLVVPLWGRLSEERVALYVEEHEPSLQAAVLSAVEVGRPEGGRARDVSRALAERLVQDAVEKCQTIDHGRHVERQGLRRASGLLAAAAALGMLVTILSPAFLRHAAPYLFAPWRGRNARPYAIDVDPGNATVARGGSQPVAARLRGFEAETAELHVRSGGRGDWKRWPMTQDAGGGPFRFVLFGVEAASDYYVEASGVRSAAFHLDVADVPYVKRVDLELHFPAYTGLPPQTVADTGDVAALAGTEVVVRVVPTMKVGAGRLDVDGDAARPMTVATDGSLSASFDVKKDGFYRIALPARDGRLQTGSPDYTIDVLADRPPTVTLPKPGHDAKVTSIEEVFTELRAEDDFGVARAELVYSVNGGPEKTLVLHPGPARKSVTAGHTFFLEELGLEPGDFISYFARATDQSAARQTTTTDIYFMEVRPFAKDYRQAEERGAGGGGGGDAAGALSYQQRQIIAATFKLARDRARSSEKQYGEDMATVALMQGRLRDQVASLVQRMANRGVAEPGSGFAKTAESLQAAQTQMAAARGELQARRAREALPPEQGALKHLQRAEAAFRDVQVSFGENGGGGRGGMEAQDLADLFELELDKLKNQYETVQRGQQQKADEEVDAALERLRALAQRQEQETERQRRLSGGPPNMGGGGGGSQRQLADEAQDLARRLERLAREKSSDSLADTARRLQEAADAMRRSGAGGQGGSLGEAKSALDRLQDARRRLESERTGRLDRDVQRALRSAEEMRQDQERIAAEAEQHSGNAPAGSAGSGSSAGASGERLQRLLDRKDALAGQVGDLESQLDRLSADARATNKDAARKLQEAADGMRDAKLKDKIRYSKGVVKSGTPEQSRQLEGEIGSDLQGLQRRLADAATAAAGSGQDKRMAALERMRGLARDLESMQERLQDAAGGRGRAGQAGSSPEAGASPAAAGAPAGTGSPGTAASGNAAGSGNGGGAAQDPRGLAAGGMPGGRPDESRQLQREMRERIREGEAIGRELGEGRSPGIPRAGADLSGALRDLHRLDDPRLYGEPRGLAQLVAQVVQGLKSAEFAMRREMEGPDREKVFLSGTQDLPPGWQALVEEYYRSLSRKPAAVDARRP